MKKTILITIATGALAASALAQGTINFLATGSTGKISYSPDGTTVVNAPTGNPSQIPLPGGGTAQLNIGFMVAANGTALTIANGAPDFTTAWSEAAVVISRITPQAGIISSTTITGTQAAGAAGANLELEVVGWTGTFTSWAAAVAGGAVYKGWSGDALSGGSLGWSQPTGNPGGSTPTSPGTLVTGAGGYNGLVLSSVPEPTTMALGGLGAAALLFFRRRK